MTSKYLLVSGLVFGLVAAAQAFRALYQLPVQIGNFEVPVWASWLAALAAGSLCAWALGSKR